MYTRRIKNEVKSNCLKYWCKHDIENVNKNFLTNMLSQTTLLKEVGKSR